MTVHGLLVGLIDVALTLCIVGMVVIGANFLILIARFLWDEIRGLDESGKSVPPLANADLPHVVLQIPVFNEPRVVEGALRAACALDWPRDRLHIQLLDDSTDETTERAAEIIAELRAAGNDVLTESATMSTACVRAASAMSRSGVCVPSETVRAPSSEKSASAMSRPSACCSPGNVVISMRGRVVRSIFADQIAIRSTDCVTSVQRCSPAI